MNSRTPTEDILIRRVSNWFNAGRPKVTGLGLTSRRNLLCPAALGSHGQEVFGVFDESTGEVQFLNSVITLPQIAREVVNSEQLCDRARLSADCQTTRCNYWQGGCRLGWFVSKVNMPSFSVKQSCPISQRCRWKAEYGEGICKRCSRIRALLIDDYQNA
jgi:hypothetical protein